MSLEFSWWIVFWSLSFKHGVRFSCFFGFGDFGLDTLTGTQTDGAAPVSSGFPMNLLGAGTGEQVSLEKNA